MINLIVMFCVGVLGKDLPLVAQVNFQFLLLVTKINHTNIFFSVMFHHEATGGT